MTASADWYPDPAGHHDVRYWDGSAWTDHVADAGVAGTESLDMDAPPPSPAPPPPPATGGGWMDKVKAVAQDVADQGKAVLNDVSAPPRSTTPTQQGPAPANGPAPSAAQSPPPVSSTSPPASAGNASPPPSASAPATKPDLVDQLRELAKLRDEGILTDEEFSDQKAKLLGT
jgi:hypothetical protein